MKKTALLITAILGFSGLSVAQQDVHFSQVLSNPYLYNPAAGGLMNVGEVSIGNRMQWANVEGRPSTYFASGTSQFKIGKKNKAILDEISQSEKAKTFFSNPQRTIGKKHVIGAKLIADQIGPFQKTSIQGSYAYHLPLTAKLNAGVGLGIGYSNFGLDENKVTLQNSGDYTYLSYIGNTTKQNMFDVSSGLVIYSNRFLFSFSATQLTKSQVRLSNIETESNFERHLYLLTSYRLDLNSTYAPEPLAILKKTANSPASFDVGARLHYANKGFLSLTYRKQSALSVGLGVNILTHFRVCYAYDLGLQATRGFGTGSHELQLGFIFGHKRNMKKEFKEDEKEQKEVKEKI